MDENWWSFKQHFLLYLTSIGASSNSGERNVALLLTVAGPQAIEVFNTFTLVDDEDKDDLDTVLELFDDFITPAISLLFSLSLPHSPHLETL